MKNNILVLCQYFYPEKISSGVLPYELSVKLAEKFQNVSALVGYPKEYAEKDVLVPNNEVVDGVSIKRIKYIQANRTGKLGRIINMVSFGCAVLFKPMQFIKNDVMICFTNPPILPFITAIYTKLLKKELITVIYDLYPDSPIKLGIMNKDNIVCRVFDKLNNYVYKTSNRIVAISEDMKQYLIQNKNIDAEKICVIHNWYEDLYEDVEYNTSEKMRIIYGGNMGTAQDMETVIDTIRILKNNSKFEFVFAGHGNKKQQIENVIKEEKIDNCIVYDFLPKAEYEKLLATSHMAILSLEKEICGIGSPSKYYSYLALKKPIIAIMPKECDVANDVRNNQIGIHVLNGESKELAERLVYLSMNQQDLQDMSMNSYRLFKQQYTLEKATEKYEYVIKEI